MDAQFLLKRLALPAIAGVGLGFILTGKPEKSAQKQAAPVPAATRTEAKLPDDLAIVKIAAVAGRSTEARGKIRELLAADAKDDEIAEWLALVLFSDPAWLDSFILTVPEDRRIALARLTILKLGNLAPDAAWELIRNSPYARVAARSDVEIEHNKGIHILGYCMMSSDLTAETILDPALGFSDEDIVRALRFARGEENARRVIDEWTRGRWKGEPPGFVRDSWTQIGFADKDGRQELEKSLPPGLRNYVDQFNALQKQDELASDSPTGTIPSVEALSKLGPGELMETFENQQTSGGRIPLKTLTKLPANLRKIGIENYFQQDDSFHPDMARQCVEQLDQLDLTTSEKQSLLEKAATSSWEHQGDYQTALDWAARMPDTKGRAKFEEKILTELAQQDPQAALDHVNAMPVGALRDKIERIATEALP